MRYTTICGSLFLAGMVFAITLAGHGPWEHHAPDEQAPVQVVVYATPVTSATSGSFFLDMTCSAVATSGFQPLVLWT
jgi:hypothetical protein